MNYREVNNDFFGYNGTIGRKDYIINLLIVVSLYVILYFTKFENLAPITKPQFLFHILMFIIGLFSFVLIISAISIIFRRISDISLNRSEKFKLTTKRIFAILYVFPIIYFYGIRYFFDTFQSLLTVIDLFLYFILLPISIITAIVLSFVKSK